MAQCAAVSDAASYRECYRAGKHTVPYYLSRVSTSNVRFRTPFPNGQGCSVSAARNTKGQEEAAFNGISILNAGALDLCGICYVTGTVVKTQDPES